MRTLALMHGANGGHCFPTGVAACVVAAALTLTGCASSGTKTYTVTVEALSRAAAPDGFSYALNTGTARGGIDPRREEVAERVRLALSQRGFFEAPNAANADFIVGFDFGEEAPRQRVNTVSQPVVMQPDPMSSNMPPSQIGGYPGTQYPNTGQYPGSGRYPSSGNTPQIVMVQTTEVIQTSVKYLRIYARDNATSRTQTRQAGGEIWSVQATIDDESVDAFANVPALIDALVEFIGTNTESPKKVTVRLASGA